MSLTDTRLASVIGELAAHRFHTMCTCVHIGDDVCVILCNHLEPHSLYSH